jgi:hypothetical protein
VISINHDWLTWEILGSGPLEKSIRQANSPIGLRLPETENHRLRVEVLYERQKGENNISRKEVSMEPPQ